MSTSNQLNNHIRDCPRRPLSAYNLFFNDERKRILNAIPSESEEMKKKKEEERPEITWPGKKKTPHRNNPFENVSTYLFLYSYHIVI